jgi:hypothetical protein
VSDTPRTDAASWREHQQSVVDADFARELERELAAALKQRDEADEECREATASWCREANETLDLYRELDAAKKRIAELDAHPPADRELRERLVCAAMTGVCSLEGWVRPEDIANHAVAIADRTLAAMRKGEQP